MEAKTKQLLFGLFAVIVAISFISSYAAVGNNNISGQSSTTSVSTNVDTLFVSGTANAIVRGYSQVAIVNVSQPNATVSAQISNMLTQLQNNGSIASITPENGGFEVFLSSINAYSLQQILSNSITESNDIMINASTTVTLPSYVTLYYQGQAADIRPGNLNYSISVSPLVKLNSTIKVAIRALVYNNGTAYDIYDDQISLSKA